MGMGLAFPGGTDHIMGRCYAGLALAIDGNIVRFQVPDPIGHMWDSEKPNRLGGIQLVRSIGRKATPPAANLREGPHWLAGP